MMVKLETTKLQHILVEAGLSQGLYTVFAFQSLANEKHCFLVVPTDHGLTLANKLAPIINKYGKIIEVALSGTLDDVTNSVVVLAHISDKCWHPTHRIGFDVGVNNHTNRKGKTCQKRPEI